MSEQQKQTSSLFNELKRLKEMSQPAPPPPQQPVQPSAPSFQQIYIGNKIKQLEAQIKQQQTPKSPSFTYSENKRDAILSWAILLMIPVFLMSIDKYESDLFNIAFIAIYISLMGYINPGMFRINPLIITLSALMSWFIFKYFVVGVGKHKAHRNKATNTNRILFVIMMMIIMTVMIRVLPNKHVFV